MHQMFKKRNSTAMPKNEEEVSHEINAIDDDWQMVAPSSDFAPETSSKNTSKQGDQAPGPFLPLTDASASTAPSPPSYADKLRSGLAEQDTTTAAISDLTTSVKAQSADLANAVRKLNQERELLAKERKRLQDKNITEQAEIHAQLNRQVIAMHHSIMAKFDEEKQKLHDQLKAGFDAELERLAKDLQDALDAEAKTRRSLLEELNDRVKEAKKALEGRVSAVEQQFRALQQQVAGVDQRVSGIEQYLRPSSQERSQQNRSGAPSQQIRSTGPAPRSRMDVNAANAAAQRQRAEGPQRETAVSQATQRAHAMHVARGQYDHDCELCS